MHSNACSLFKLFGLCAGNASNASAGLLFDEYGFEAHHDSRSPNERSLFSKTLYSTPCSYLGSCNVILNAFAGSCLCHGHAATGLSILFGSRHHLPYERTTLKNQDTEPMSQNDLYSHACQSSVIVLTGTLGRPVLLAL